MDTGAGAVRMSVHNGYRLVRLLQMGSNSLAYCETDRGTGSKRRIERFEKSGTETLLDGLSKNPIYEVSSHGASQTRPSMLTSFRIDQLCSLD